MYRRKQAEFVFAALATVFLVSACTGESPTRPVDGPGISSSPESATGTARQLAKADESVRIKIQRKARLEQVGQIIVVRLKATCQPVGLEVLEAFVQASQDDVFGEGFIDNVQCDGKPRKYTVEVRAIEGAFQEGRAFASAFILICDEEGAVCEQGQDSRIVSVRTEG
jgi:hypothetical protein